MKQFFGKKSRSMLASVIMLSLLLHVVAMVVFGTIKFVEAMREEEKVFEVAPVDTPPQTKPEYTVNIQQRNKSTPPPRPPAIVVNNPSEMDIPALDIDVNVDSSAVYGRGGGGFGGGLAGVREMAITADLFGVSVTAENLGVILDISGSAHAYLSQAIEEIDRNFPKAHMVLVVGCGMSDGTAAIQGGGGKVPGKPRVVPYNRRGSDEQYDNLERSVAPTNSGAILTGGIICSCFTEAISTPPTSLSITSSIRTWTPSTGSPTSGTTANSLKSMTWKNACEAIGAP